MTQTRDQKTVEVFRLLKPFWPWLTLSVLTGIAAGLATVALLATINRVLHSSAGMSGAVLAVFILLCAISLVGRTVSDIAANLVGQRLVADVRKTLAQKILAAPIDALERYRSYRLMPVLTQDVDMISDVAFVLASTLISVAVALGCLGYLAYLSPSMFVMLVVMMTIGTVLQSLAQARGVAGFRKARDHEEALHKSYRGISEGAKELRMHRERRKRLYAGYIGATVDAAEAGLAPFAPVAPILAPGFGAQGATPADLARRFGPQAASVIASESRSLLSAGPAALAETIADRAAQYREVSRG